MQSQTLNPALRPSVRVFALVVALIVAVGSSLLFLPELMAGRWLWPLTPFNTRFLGAVYFAELAGVLMLLFNSRWFPGRLVLPMALCFAGVVSVASLLALDRFDFQRRATWLWFVLYIGSALIALYFLWAHRHRARVVGLPISKIWHNSLLLQGVLLTLYGVGLMLMPTLLSGFWPWPIDAFHAQIYSAVFITGGVGSLIAARGATPIELLTLGIAQAVLGFAAIIGVMIVDASVRRIDWSLAGTWLWFGLFAALALTGLGIIWYGYSLRRGRSHS